MNLDDYEKECFSTYRAFAETVRFILKKALQAADNLPRPQSVQCRAKGVDSLRRRLAEMDKLETQTLELDRRDLAGVRVIFYTNNDIACFLRSSVIRDNFEIDEDSTRIHYPTVENKGTQYRAVHYFDCFRFVFCLSLMEVGGYVVSSGTGGQARFALVAFRIRRPSVREYRIRTVFAGYARRPRGVAEP